jgi:hypothetical protein
MASVHAGVDDSDDDVVAGRARSSVGVCRGLASITTADATATGFITANIASVSDCGATATCRLSGPVVELVRVLI